MDVLQQQKEATSQVLTPSLSRYFSELWRRAVSRTGEFFRLRVLRQSPRRLRLERELRHDVGPGPIPTAPTVPTTPSRPPGMRHAVVTAASGISRTLRFVGNLFSRSTASNLTGTVGAVTPRRRTVSSAIAAIERLPRVSRYLLLVAAVVAFALAQSWYSTASSQNQQSAGANYERTVATIAEYVQKAEAALTYGDEAGARTRLDEAQRLQQTLPQKSSSQKKTAQDLQTSIDVQRNTMKHVTTIDPRELTNFTAAAAGSQPNHLALVGSSLFATDAAAQSLYEIATDSGVVTTITLPIGAPIQYAAPQKSTILLLDTGGKLYEYAPATKKTTPLNFSLGSTEFNIAGIATYESRLYLVDLKQNQILRANRGGNDYSSPVAWIKDATDVRQAAGIAVDGNVFILYQNGGIDKLFQGKRQAWTADTVSPPVAKGSRIIAGDATANLFILDPTEKRIIELTKDGGLLHQYTSSVLTAPQDFAVDVTTKTLYVLNGTSILTADIH
ncbi:MAG: hypothetical protein V1916_00315 [Patescibacteria group bacterium]